MCRADIWHVLRVPCVVLVKLSATHILGKETLLILAELSRHVLHGACRNYLIDVLRGHRLDRGTARSVFDRCFAVAACAISIEKIHSRAF